MTDRVTGWLAALAGAGAILAAMTAAMVALGAPAALAQADADPPQQARIAPPDLPGGAAPGLTGGYDRPTLDAFARATRIVGALRNEYSPKIAAANIAGRPDRAEALFDEMRARMHDAIDATGLAIETYEAIAARAERDRALRARIEAIMTGVRPPADPGLGVEAPAAAPRTPVSRAGDDAGAKLARARGEIDRLHRLIDTERSRARAERERAESDAAALRASLEGAIEGLAVRVREAVSAASSGVPEELAALRMAAIRNDLARVALAREIARLTRDFAAAGDAMAALGTDLADAPAPGVPPLTRLDARPVLLAGSLPALARDLTAVQSRDALRARLDAEQTRNLALRARHTAERVALRREIERIGRDLGSATSALAELAGATAEPPMNTRAPTDAPDPTAVDAPDSAAVAARAIARVAAGTAAPAMPAPAMPAAGDPMHDQEVYRPVPAVRPAPPHTAPTPPAAPEQTPVPAAAPAQTGSLEAGIRAYEAGDYARAYTVWQPLAEAGEARAQFHLGALYFEGRGVRRDLGQARRWLRRALGQGDERARFLLSRVEAQIAAASGSTG